MKSKSTKPKTTPPGSSPAIITVKDAAAILGVTKSRVHQLLRSRGITPNRLTPVGYARQGLYVLTAEQLDQIKPRNPVESSR